MEHAANGKRKPGYVASARGARLVVDTLAAGAHRVAIGYLRTYTSGAAWSLQRGSSRSEGSPGRASVS